MKDIAAARKESKKRIGYIENGGWRKQPRFMEIEDFKKDKKELDRIKVDVIVFIYMKILGEDFFSKRIKAGVVNRF